MADNQLVANAANLPTYGVSKYADQDAFDQLVRSSFMPRVQLCQGNNEFVVTGKLNMAHFGFIRTKEDFIDLGKEYQFYPLAMRFVAMRFGEGTVEQYFNPKSDEFKAVQAESEEKDSKCAYGPQFLIWVPALKEYATFLFGSKSARPEGRKMKMLMEAKSAGTMKGRLVKNPSYTWHIPIVIPFSSAIEPFNEETAQELAAKFLDHGESSVETEFAPETPAQPAAAAAGERPR